MTGAEVLAYCFMTNHFHILVYVPPRELSDGPKRPAELRAALGFGGGHTPQSVRQLTFSGPRSAKVGMICRVLGYGG